MVDELEICKALNLIPNTTKKRKQKHNKLLNFLTTIFKKRYSNVHSSLFHNSYNLEKNKIAK